MKYIPEHYEITEDDYKLLGEMFIKEVGLKRALEVLSRKQFSVIKGKEWEKFFYE